jgi:hypothetical protein
MTFNTWLAKTPLGSAFKTFVAIVLGAMIADWVSGGTVNLNHWQAWLTAGAASAIPPVIDWLNPKDTRFGTGSTPATGA